MDCKQCEALKTELSKEAAARVEAEELVTRLKGELEAANETVIGLRDDLGARTKDVLAMIDSGNALRERLAEAKRLLLEAVDCERITPAFDRRILAHLNPPAPAPASEPAKQWNLHAGFTLCEDQDCQDASLTGLRHAHGPNGRTQHLRPRASEPVGEMEPRCDFRFRDGARCVLPMSHERGECSRTAPSHTQPTQLDEMRERMERLECHQGIDRQEAQGNARNNAQHCEAIDERLSVHERRLNRHHDRLEALEARVTKLDERLTGQLTKLLMLDAVRKAQIEKLTAKVTEHHQRLTHTFTGAASKTRENVVSSPRDQAGSGAATNQARLSGAAPTSPQPTAPAAEEMPLGHAFVQVPTSSDGEHPVLSARALDACCGGRMMWFDKNNPDALFVDQRRLPRQEIWRGVSGGRGAARSFEVAPSVQADFRSLPMADESFSLVVFDPPHLAKRNGKAGWMQVKYGSLTPATWKEDLRRGFAECFRVLKTDGTLIFKWSSIEIPLSQVLALTDRKPLFGHRSGRQQTTHWVAFLK